LYSAALRYAMTKFAKNLDCTQNAPNRNSECNGLLTPVIRS
jgi:hypothetical protein